MSWKFNPFTGELDQVGSTPASSADNFSYVEIPTGITITVPGGQLMVYEGDLVIDGDIDLSGSITQMVDYSLWAFSWKRITQDKVIRVPEDQQMLVTPGLVIDGILALDGDLVEVS